MTPRCQSQKKDGDTPMALPKMLSTSLIEIVVDATMAGQAIQNVLHYSPVLAAPAPTVTFDLLDAITAFRDSNWRADVIPLMNQAYKVNRYVIRELSGVQPTPVSDPKAPFAITVRQFLELPAGGEDDQGTVVDDYIPTFNAVSYYRNTGMDGRKGAGHVRLGGVSKGQLLVADGQKLSNAAFADYQAIQEDFSVRTVDPGIGGDTIVPCLFLRAKALDTLVPITDMRPYQKLFNSIVTRRLLTSQVSRKQTNRGGL